MAQCWFGMMFDRCNDAICSRLIQTPCCRPCKVEFDDLADEDFIVGNERGQTSLRDSTKSSTLNILEDKHEEECCCAKADTSCYKCCRKLPCGKCCCPSQTSSNFHREGTYKKFTDYNDSGLYPQQIKGSTKLIFDDDGSIMGEDKKTSFNLFPHSRGGSDIELSNIDNNIIQLDNNHMLQTDVVIHQPQSETLNDQEMDQLPDNIEVPQLFSEDLEGPQVGPSQLPDNIEEPQAGPSKLPSEDHIDLAQFNSMKDYLRKQSIDLSLTSSYCGDSITSLPESTTSVRSYEFSSSSESLNTQLTRQESDFFDNKERKLIKVAQIMNSDEFLNVVGDSSSSDSLSDADGLGKRGHKKSIPVKPKRSRKRAEVRNSSSRVTFTDTCTNGVEIIVTDYDPDKKRTDSFTELDYIQIGQDKNEHSDDNFVVVTEDDINNQIENKQSSGHGGMFDLTYDDDSCECVSIPDRRDSEACLSETDNVFVSPEYKQTSV